MAATLALLSLGAVAGATSLAGLLSLPNTYPDLRACAKTPSFYSCENTTAVANSCCSPTPGGLVLQTQFWDTYTGFEKQGQILPKNSWTIHGLWPDNCDGSYASYCDLGRQYDPSPSPAKLSNGTVVPPYNGTTVDTFLIQFGRLDLLAYMEQYWVSQGESNAAFWAHEFSKHATCTSTFDVACYGPDYKKHQDVVDFFQATVRAFQQYPTYEFLATAGIVPSNQTAYPLASIQDAIYNQVGALPYLGCSGPNHTVLSEVWYHQHVFGTEQLGKFKSINTTSPATSCNTTLPIWYYERTKTSEREVRLLP